MRPVALIALAGCAGGPVEEGTSRTEVVAALAGTMVVEDYAALAEGTATLAVAAEALCASPDAGSLEAARRAWDGARGAWMRGLVVKFGPVVEYPERFGPRLDGSPVDGEAVEALVAGGAALDAGSFALLGSSTRGLPVVEWLLWTPDALGALPGRRCEALVGASADVAASAEALAALWGEVWVDRIGAPTPGDDRYDTVQDALDEWVNRMGFTAEDVRGVQLGEPLGDGSGGEPRPELLFSRPSGRSLADARDTLAGVRRVWAPAHAGVSDLAGGPVAAAVDAALDGAEAALAAIPEPLEAALVDDRAAVQEAQEALRQLQVAIQVDLAQDLGVTITFNDNDGD